MIDVKSKQDCFSHGIHASDSKSKARMTFLETNDLLLLLLDSLEECNHSEDSICD